MASAVLECFARVSSISARVYVFASSCSTVSIMGHFELVPDLTTERHILEGTNDLRIPIRVNHALIASPVLRSVDVSKFCARIRSSMAGDMVETPRRALTVLFWVLSNVTTASKRSS